MKKFKHLQHTDCNWYIITVGRDLLSNLVQQLYNAAIIKRKASGDAASWTSSLIQDYNSRNEQKASQPLCF